MRIRIFARSFFEARQGTRREIHWLSRYRIISINSICMPEFPPFTQTFWDRKNLLILFFDDIETAEKNSLSVLDAEKIVDFALQADPRPILIHCTAGESRSGAVGLFLNKILNANHQKDREQFYLDYPWVASHANQFVLSRLTEACQRKKSQYIG